MKEKIGNELSYIKAGYRSDQWKWALSLKSDNDEPITSDQLKEEHILRTYNLDRIPKNLPCVKKCSQNAWCLTELRNGSKEKGKLRPTDQPRDPALPLGLQNTANTCWINSALQGLYHLPWFRNLINSVDGFIGEESLSFMVYLLQAMFVEMEVHSNKAIACTPGSVFECIGLFATREIMRKDADHEVLKCVSEFLENTIDNLMADPRLGPELGPLFSTTLTRLARWKCPICETEHEIQLPPATFYTVGAYVSADECPLDQCLMDLQTETQTGVSLVCGAGAGAQGGCGAKIKTDRIVTPKIQNLPRILVIRNNSLVDRDLKRRLHVVYPDTLDLTSHTLHHVAASYSLHAVIYHHGHWVKHFSAHVKTGEGKWFNFNDEHVSEVVNRSSSGNPPETHRNYFSVANIASKYKHRLGLRVSRGAFVWMYVRNDAQEEPKVLPPPESVVQYVLQKQQENKEVKHQQMAEIQSERNLLMERLAIRSPSEDYVLVSEALLSAWLACDGPIFTALPKQLAKPLCEHRLFSPKKIYDLKCIRAEEIETLLSVRCGIHIDESTRKLGLPVVLPPSQGPCQLCMVKAANHILFLERLRNLYKNAKKEAKKVTEGPSILIGSDSLENWPRYAIKAYMKENGLDSEDIEGDIDGSREGDGGTTSDFGSRITDTESDQVYNSVTSEEGIADSDKYLCKTDVIASTAGDRGANGMNNAQSDSVPETKNSNGFYDRDSSEGLIVSSSESDKDSNNTKVTPSLSTKSISKNKDIKALSEEKKKDTNSEDVELLFNEELVCEHGLRSPMASSSYVPEDIAMKIMELCKNSLHPAMLTKDFDNCINCVAKLDKSMDVCQAGIRLKKELGPLIQEKKRPHPSRDVGSIIYVISREFFYNFKSFLRACDRLDLQVPVISEIENQSLFCKHNKLLYHTATMEPHDLSQYMVLMHEEEWRALREAKWTVDHEIIAHFDDFGRLTTELGVCEEGCVEEQAAREYEDQFCYECEIVNVRQVNSVADIPRRQSRTRHASAAATTPTTHVLENFGPRKKPRLTQGTCSSAGLGSGMGGGDGGGRGVNTHRLVRASKTFSSTDTLREVQNFIAERTGIWPMLQTLWICPQDLGSGEPQQLGDEQRAMTLNALRIRPGDTIYFRAAMEDMEKAAGDGVIEYNEMDYFQ